MARRWTVLVALLALPACETGAAYELVEDLRVLAIAAEPPELRAAGDVTFRALVADPRGGDIHFAWSFCPVESSTACMNYDDLRAEAPAGTSQSVPGPVPGG